MMNRGAKRFLALILSVMMVLSGMSVSATAESAGLGEIPEETTVLQSVGARARSGGEDSSSGYVVEFYYARRGTFYTIPGNDTVSLRTVMNAIGLSGIVDAARVSGTDGNSLAVSKTGGVYYVTMGQPFPGATLTLTINDTDHPIAVTGNRLFISSFAEMQTELDTESRIVLFSDVIAEPEEEALNIPAGRTVRLDLNGYRIDRGLDAYRGFQPAGRDRGNRGKRV